MLIDIVSRFVEEHGKDRLIGCRATSRGGGGMNTFSSDAVVSQADDG